VTVGGDRLEHVELVVGPAQFDRQPELGGEVHPRGDLVDVEVRPRLPVADAAQPGMGGVAPEQVGRVGPSEDTAADDRVGYAGLVGDRLEPGGLDGAVLHRVRGVDVHRPDEVSARGLGEELRSRVPGGVERVGPLPPAERVAGLQPRPLQPVDGVIPVVDVDVDERLVGHRRHARGGRCGRISIGAR